MNYADIKYPDIQDGTGIRLALYVSGCHFHCKNCHNQVAWDPDYGKKFTDETIEYILNKFEENKDYNEGLSLLGGEPLEIYNQEGLTKLTKEFKRRFPDKNIWCWTGYDFEKDIINDMYKENKVTRELLENIDVIVDGTYQEDKKLIDLIARGSYNQTKIDVQESIKQHKTIKLKFGDESRFENIETKPKTILIKKFDDENLENKTENDIVVMPIEVENEKENIITNIIEIKKEEEKISADGIFDNNP